MGKHRENKDPKVTKNNPNPVQFKREPKTNEPVVVGYQKKSLAEPKEYMPTRNNPNPNPFKKEPKANETVTAVTEDHPIIQISNNSEFVNTDEQIKVEYQPSIQDDLDIQEVFYKASSLQVKDEVKKEDLETSIKLTQRVEILTVELDELKAENEAKSKKITELEKESNHLDEQLAEKSKEIDYLEDEKEKLEAQLHDININQSKDEDVEESGEERSDDEDDDIDGNDDNDDDNNEVDDAMNDDVGDEDEEEEPEPKRKRVSLLII